jgi:hypothetical protein
LLPFFKYDSNIWLPRLALTTRNGKESVSAVLKKTRKRDIPRKDNKKVGRVAMAEYLINLTWDNEASVWIATSDDITGLGLGLDPELLSLSKKIETQTLFMLFRSERYEQVRL